MGGKEWMVGFFFFVVEDIMLKEGWGVFEVVVDIKFFFVGWVLVIFNVKDRLYFWGYIFEGIVLIVWFFFLLYIVNIKG